MPHLFSPLKIARLRLPNRIVLAPLHSGCATPDGFVAPPMLEYYLHRAQGGVGLLVLEPALALAPPAGLRVPHLGLYHDAFVPALAAFVSQVRATGARVLVLLDAPADVAQGDAAQLADLREGLIRAGWRALAAGCDGLLLSAADGGALHTLLSPLRNQRNDRYGTDLDGRLRLSLEVVEGLKEWLGRRLLIGFRMEADELTPGGITLQDARLIAKRLVSAGVGLLDITVPTGTLAPVAHFPGWRVPMAAGIKRVLPDVPVITSGGLDDPQLADGAIRDGSIDLVMLGRSLRADPAWPQHAYATLYPASNGTTSPNGEPPLDEFIFDDEDLYA